MPFVEYTRMPKRISLKRKRIHRKEGSILIFEPSPEVPSGYLTPSISISTLTGGLLGAIPSGIQNTIINSIEYTNSERGSDEAVLILNQLPPFPLAVYSTISITVNGQPDYKGYMWKPFDPGNTKNETFKYEFYGLRKKYEKTPIETTQNFTISSITRPGGTTSRYNVTTTTAGINTNQMLAARGCTSDFNNLYSMITAVGSNWFEITNPVGVAQAGTGGDIRVLPAEWSSSNLISLLFTQLVTTYGSGLGIGYVPAKVIASTGSNTLGYVDFNGSTLQQAIEMLEKMTLGSYVMGVDRAGDYFFKPVPAVNDVLNVGYNIHNFQLTRNFDKIINVVDVRRAKGHSEGGNGWVTASVGSDATSIAKYGRRSPSEATITIPEYFSDDVADLIRDNTLATFKDPKYFCKIKGVRMTQQFDNGFYRFSSYPDIYSTIFDELDSLTGWTFGANISRSIDTTTLVTGAGSFKLDLTSSSNGQSATKSGLSFAITGKKTLSFWIRGTRAGQFIQVSFTDGANTTSANVYISVPNEFYYFTLDISSSLVNTITSLSFNVSGVTSATTIYIDEISVECLGSLQIVMPFKKVKTYFRTNEFLQDLELGLQYDKLSEYMQGLQTQVSSHNLFLKDRKF